MKYKTTIEIITKAENKKFIEALEKTLQGGR